jgi:hypothetical protein
MITTSTLFDLLADRHRRRVLVLLCDRERLRIPEDVMSRGGVRSTRTTNGRGPDASRGDDFDVRLEHVDLPKLDDAGLVEWNRTSRSVSRGPNFGQVEPALRLLSDNPDRFPPDLL